MTTVTEQTTDEHAEPVRETKRADQLDVGDWLNDVPMFKVCGRSFAMAQAPEIVKEAATDHLLAHGSRGGGIAEAIERAWGSL